MADPPIAWENKVVSHADVDPADLLMNPNNWRLHPKYQMDALNGALEEVGWVRPVIVNEVTGHIVDGHARVQQAINTGQEAVPVAYVHLTRDEENLALATLDAVGELTLRDTEKMHALLEEVQPEDEHLTSLMDSFMTGEVEDWDSEISERQKNPDPEFRCYVGEFSFPVDRDILTIWQSSVMHDIGSDNPDDVFAALCERLGLNGYLAE